MKCTQVLSQLDDYVDGHLEATEALQVRLHIDGCSDCGGEERSLRRLLAEAAALPVVVEPRRDLWPGIADRISPKNVRRLGPGWVQGLLAASVLIATIGLGYVVLRPGDLPPAARVGTPALDDALPVREMTDSLRAILTAEEALEQAKLQLRQALSEQRATLAPETQEMVDRNLSIIEDAIGEIRVALDSDPGNAELGRMLLAAHQSEIQLLQRFTRLAFRQ